jgi:hydroxypyruvate reductase
VALGYPASVHERLIQGDALQAGGRLADWLARQAPAGIHIWGGETTVTLPPQPGRGGRNQSLALAAAIRLAGNDQVAMLAAGTDGTDGPGQDAGGLVDGSSLARGAERGLDAQTSLEAADAGHFLHAAGDLLYTGPTGTNVMDLVLGLKLAPA